MRTTRSATFGNGLAILSLVGLFAVQASATGFELDAAIRQKIDAEGQRLVDEQRTPGLAIGVMHDGKIVYAKGFGLANLETNTSATPDTVFMIGSITKQFTAACIVLLAEQGMLKVDDPVSKYFPDFPRGNEVTLRHLLTHTSGIHPIMGGGGANPTPQQMASIRTPADMVKFIQGLPTLYDFDPGTSYRYSNSGYWLLGAIIEKVSGLSIADFMKKNIFEPAGMTATAMNDEREVVPNRASGYLKSADGKAFINPMPMLLAADGGAGGIRSTVNDMLRWQDALLGGRIVSPAGVKEMTTPRTLNNGQPALEGGPGGMRGYGFGLGLGQDNGHSYISHNGGSSQGFTAVLKAYPQERVAFVVLTNIGVGGQLRQRVPELPQAREQPPEGAKKAGKRKMSPSPDGEPGVAMGTAEFLSNLISTSLPREQK